MPPPLQTVLFQHSPNPTQENVYDRLLDQNYWTGTYKQRFNDYSQGRPKTAEYKPYEVGGAENFWEMTRKRKGQRAVDAGTGRRYADNLRPSRFCRTLFQIERAALLAQLRPDAHSR